MNTNSPESQAEGENNEASKERQAPNDAHAPGSHTEADDISKKARERANKAFNDANSTENTAQQNEQPDTNQATPEQEPESEATQTPDPTATTQPEPEPGFWAKKYAYIRSKLNAGRNTVAGAFNAAPKKMRNAKNYTKESWRITREKLRKTYTQAEPTILRSKELTGKKLKKAIFGYRKLREKNEINRTIDSGVRGVGGGFVGAIGSEGAVMAAGSSISSSIALGGSLLTNVAAPIGFPALAPAASLLGRRLYAKLMHEKAVSDVYEGELIEVAKAAYPTKNDDSAEEKGKKAEARAKFIADFKEAVENVERTSHGRSHIDTIEEKNLIEIMAKYAHCSPAEVPYLGSVERYSKYVFAKFREACEELSKNSKIKSLSAREQVVVDLFHIEVADKDSPEEKMKLLKQLWEVSTEYGKLIAYTHRKNRDTQLNGQILGGVLVSAPLLGFAPAIAGAGLYAARKYYTDFRKPKNIEFDSHGHLRVRIDIHDEMDDGKALLKKDVFNRKMLEADIGDNHKYWMGLMKLDEEVLHAPDLTSAYQLGIRQQEHVMKLLTGKALPPAKIKDEDKQKAEADYKVELASLNELKTEYRKLESDLKKVESEYTKYKETLDDLEETDALQKAQMPALKANVKESKTRMTEMKLEVKNLKEKIEGSDGQEARTKKAKLKWDMMMNPAKSSLKLSSDPSKMFIVSEYQKSSEEENAEKEKIAKKKRLDSMRAPFRKEYGNSYTYEGNDIDPNEYDVEDLKRKSQELQEEYENTKSEASPNGDDGKKRDWMKAKKEFDETSRFVLMLKEVKEAEDNFDKIVKEKKSQLETNFDIIREAFAMKVKKEWEDHNAHASPSMFKSVRSTTSEYAKNAGTTLLQEAGTLAIKAAVPGAMAAGAYGLLHLAGTGFILNPISAVIHPGFVIGLVAALGGIAHINSRLKEGGINLVNMITGGKKKKVESEKKTETTVTPPASH